MADLSGTVVVSKIIPTNSADTYPTHDQEYGLGGFRTVADIAARDAIPAGRRSEGMKVFSVADNQEFQLRGGITNADWKPIVSGSTSSGYWLLAFMGLA
jgi:hypothetical protein